MQMSVKRIKLLRDWDGLVYVAVNENGKKTPTKFRFRPKYRMYNKNGFRRFVKNNPWALPLKTFNESTRSVETLPKCTPIEDGLLRAFYLKHL